MAENISIWYKGIEYGSLGEIKAPEVGKYTDRLVRRLFHTAEDYREIIIRNMDGMDFVSYSKKTLVPAKKTFDLSFALACVMEDRLRSGPCHVLEIGTGTGVFPITLRALISDPNLIITATDISGDALTVADLNIQLNGLCPNSIRLIKKDGLANTHGLPCLPDIVFSNPPFSPTNRINFVNAGGVHPVLALDGGGDGTYYYERFLFESRRILKHKGSIIFQLPLGADDIQRTMRLIACRTDDRAIALEDCMSRYRKVGPQFVVIGNNNLPELLSRHGYTTTEI